MEIHYPTINQSFKLILLLFLISIPTAIPFALVKALLPDLSESGLVESFLILASYAASFYWIIWIAKRRTLKEGKWGVVWKYNRVSAIAVLMFAAMGMALMTVVDPLTELIPMPQGIIEMFKEVIKPNVFSFLMIVVAAPLLEEMFFRGIILEGFLRNYNERKAIMWSAVIFGAAHFNPWQTVSATFGGLLLGWAYVRTNSLIPGIAIHAAVNCVGFVMMTYFDSDTLTGVLSARLYYFLMAISAVLLVTFYIIVEKKRGTQTSQVASPADPL